MRYLRLELNLKLCDNNQRQLFYCTLYYPDITLKNNCKDIFSIFP